MTCMSLLTMCFKQHQTSTFMCLKETTGYLISVLAAQVNTLLGDIFDQRSLWTDGQLPFRGWSAGWPPFKLCLLGPTMDLWPQPSPLQDLYPLHFLQEKSLCAVDVFAVWHTVSVCPQKGHRNGWRQRSQARREAGMVGRNSSLYRRLRIRTAGTIE